MSQNANTKRGAYADLEEEVSRVTEVLRSYPEVVGRKVNVADDYDNRRIMLGSILTTTVVALAVLIYFGLPFLSGANASAAPETAGSADSSEGPEAAETSSVAVNAAGEVIADGMVVPVERAALSMAQSGIVAEILVAEGEEVKAGDVILRLRNARQIAAVTQAQALTAKAQANLDEMQAGAHSHELASAQADLDAAQARLAQISEGARSEEIAAARSKLAAAQAELDQLYSGPEENERIVMEKELANAQAQRDVAQSAYDLIAWRGDAGRSPESAALQEATNNYEAAKARYDALFIGPNADAVANAQAKIQQAQADLNKLLTPGTQNEINEAEASVRRNQAALDLLLEGTRPAVIAGARAELDEARGALMEAEANLADTELRAAFGGVVAAIDVKPGEQAIAGQPVVQLANLTDWQIETDDLTELNVIYVQQGDPVMIRFDAIEGLEIAGTVARIRPIGKNNQGEITYTAIVQPHELDPRLRWNMTAVVTIQ